MKHNIKYYLNIFFKKNYLFAAFLLFAYLIYSIINNNFYESFIIFIILILGYLLINFKIFYILILLIIISNLFFNFNKLIEGNSECPYVDPNIYKYVNKQSQKIQSSIATTPNRNYYQRIDKQNVGNTATNTARNNKKFSGKDENSGRSDLSKSCADKMVDSKIFIKPRKYQPDVCPMPSPSVMTQSNITNVPVTSIAE